VSRNWTWFLNCIFKLRTTVRKYHKIFSKILLVSWKPRTQLSPCKVWWLRKLLQINLCYSKSLMDMKIETMIAITTSYKNRHLVSISSTLYVRNILYECRFSSYVLALLKNLYEKRALITLMKLTTGQKIVRVFIWTSLGHFRNRKKILIH